MHKASLRFLHELRKDQTITVKRADKNLGLVVLNRQSYIDEAMRQLNDHTAYMPMSSTQALTLMNEAFNKLKQFKDRMDPDPFQYIMQHCSHTTVLDERNCAWPEFYLLMKLHKTPVVGRPIVAAHSFLLTPASVWIDAQLQPLLALHASVLRDSFTFLRDLAAFPSPPEHRNCVWLIADVHSLYTVMKKEDTLSALKSFLKPHIATKQIDQHTASLILDLTELILSHTVFRFNGTLFQQITGTPMGTPSGCALGNIYLLVFVDHRINTQFRSRISFYRRLIDDLAFRCIDMNTALAARSWLERCHPSLKFVFTLATDSFDFLDLHVQRAPGFASHGKYFTRLYEKPISKFLYTPFNSFHPLHNKSALVIGELTRASRLCSRPTDFLDFRVRFFQRLTARGFPLDLLLSWSARVKWSDRDKFLRTPTTKDARPPPTLPVLFDPLSASIPLRPILDRNWQATYGTVRAPVSQRPPIISWRVARSTGALITRARL